MVALKGQRPEPIPERFVAADQYFDCRACIAWHGKTFLFPELVPGNREVWALYLRLQDQQRYGGMGESAGLDYSVLPLGFRYLGDWNETERRELFEKIILINSLVAKHHAEERENKRKAAEAEAKWNRMEAEARARSH